MATVDDAVEFLRDPAFVAVNGRRAETRAAGLMEISGTRIVNELPTSRSGDTRGHARPVREALVIVGERDASYLLPPSKALRPGRPMAKRRRCVEVYRVPIDE